MQYSVERNSNIACVLQNNLFFQLLIVMNLPSLWCLFQGWMVWKESSGINESMWSCSLCDFSVVQKLQGRSLCQEFCFLLPRRLLCSIFLLQQVPRLYQYYLFIAFPSLPNWRHCWHWLRCVKNLLVFKLSVPNARGKRLQQCPGTALFWWWKFFEDRSFASYLLHCCKRRHEHEGHYKYID